MRLIRHFIFHLFLLLLCSLPATLLAQEQMGIKADNYAGINRVTLNPSVNVFSPNNWDITFGAVGFFVDNNYGYLENTYLIEILQNIDNIELAPSLTDDATVNNSAIYFDFFNNEQKKHLFMNTAVMGPAFRFNVKNSSFGFFTAARSVISVRDVSPNLGYYQFLNHQVNEPVEITAMDAGGMAWAEVGINYAKSLTNSEKNSLSFGFNLRYLQGTDAFYAHNAEGQTVTKVPNSFLNFSNGNGSAGVASSLVNSNIEEEGYQFSTNGWGVGADFGVTLALFPRDHHRVKIGASLLDVGKIWYQKNVEAHTYESDGAFSVDLTAFNEVENPEDFYEVVNAEVGETVTHTQQEQFGMALPTALSLQGDLGLTKNLWVNGTIVRRLNLLGVGGQRANMIAVTPRLEFRFMSIAVPMVMYENQGFRLGSALRFGPLTVGSDNLMSIVKSEPTFTGTDVYASVKINQLRVKWKKRNRNKKSKDYGCPQVMM